MWLPHKRRLKKVFLKIFESNHCQDLLIKQCILWSLHCHLETLQTWRLFKVLSPAKSGKNNISFLSSFLLFFRLSSLLFSGKIIFEGWLELTKTTIVLPCCWQYFNVVQVHRNYVWSDKNPLRWPACICRVR